MNRKFIAEVHGRTRPLAVENMAQAAEVLGAEIARGPAADTTPEQWARHLAWVIGLDVLLEDRARLRDLSSYMVEGQA